MQWLKRKAKAFVAKVVAFAKRRPWGVALCVSSTIGVVGVLTANPVLVWIGFMGDYITLLGLILIESDKVMSVT